MALRFWLANEAPPLLPQGIRTDTGGVFNFLESSTECAIPDPAGFFSILYWSQISRTHWSVFACWDHFFDAAIYVTTKGEWAARVKDRVAHAWPVYTRLTTNGAEGRLTEGAIVSIRSDEEQSAVAIQFASPEIARLEDFFEGASGEAADRLIRINAELLQETRAGVESIPHLVTAFYGDDRTTRRLKAFASAVDHLHDFTDLMR